MPDRCNAELPMPPGTFTVNCILKADHTGQHRALDTWDIENDGGTDVEVYWHG